MLNGSKNSLNNNLYVKGQSDLGSRRTLFFIMRCISLLEAGSWSSIFKSNQASKTNQREGTMAILLFITLGLTGGLPFHAGYTIKEQFLLG